MEVPVARVLRDFRGLHRDALAGRTSSREKHLEKFFKTFVLSVLATGPSDWPWRLARNLIQSRKTRVLRIKDNFILKIFSFPSNILSVYCPLSLIHRVSHLNHHFHHLLNFNLQEKVWVFLNFSMIFLIVVLFFIELLLRLGICAVSVIGWGYFV